MPHLPPPPATVHLMGIGGAALGSLAELLQDLGYRVRGADNVSLRPSYGVVDDREADLSVLRVDRGDRPADEVAEPATVNGDDALPVGDLDGHVGGGACRDASRRRCRPRAAGGLRPR